MRGSITWFRAFALVLATTGLAGCAGTGSDGPAQCVAAGGRCVIGPPTNCVGMIGSEDCNPDRNPGGAICCLPCPTGETPVDGGTGCHAKVAGSLAPRKLLDSKRFLESPSASSSGSRKEAQLWPRRGGGRCVCITC